MAISRSVIVLARKNGNPDAAGNPTHLLKCAFWFDTPAALSGIASITLVVDGKTVVASSVSAAPASIPQAERDAIASGVALEFVMDDLGAIPDAVNATQLATFLVGVRNVVAAALNARRLQQLNTKNNAVGQSIDINGAWIGTVVV